MITSTSPKQPCVVDYCRGADRSCVEKLDTFWQADFVGRNETWLQVRSIHTRVAVRLI